MVSALVCSCSELVFSTILVLIVGGSIVLYVVVVIVVFVFELRRRRRRRRRHRRRFRRRRRRRRRRRLLSFLGSIVIWLTLIHERCVMTPDPYESICTQSVQMKSRKPFEPCDASVSNC